jgi:hypothetical protein
VATEGLHPPLDQASRGRRGPAEALGNIGQGPALEVAKADGFALVGWEHRQRLEEALRLLAPDGLLAGRRVAGVEVLL